MASYTTRYALTKPTVGGDADVWGTGLNTSLDDIDYLLGAITTTGSSNAYLLTTGLSLAAYVTGQSFDIIASFSNSSTVTINVDGLGAKAITKNGTTALASGDIVSGNAYRITYDGTRFQLIGTTATGVYQPLDALLTAIAALTTADDRMLDFTGTDTVAVVSYATVVTNLSALTTSTGAQLANVNQTIQGIKRFANTGAAAHYIEIEDQYHTYRWGFNSSAYPGLSNSSGTALTEYDTNNLAHNFYVGDTRILAAPTSLATNSAGFRGAPYNAQGGDYTFVLADAGGAVYHSSGTHAYTIPPDSSVAFPIGTVIIVYHFQTALTIVEGSGVTLYRWDGTNATGTRTVAPYGTVALYKQATNAWLISGNISA